jgi:cobalt-precorrin-7 (C5)-methyltransferase
VSEDPAAVAAAAPEGSSDARVYAAGIGPGNPEYLLPRTRRALEAADVVVGFDTVVEYARDAVDTAATWLSCGYADEGETLDAFAERVADGADGVAVLMGDPNHSGYQFVGKVEAAVDGPVRVLPGISSLQVAASRARTPMEATTFVTLHRSGPLAGSLARLRRDAGERNLLVLPRPYDWMPGDVAAHLLESGGARDATALVCERLTHDDETITRTTLGDLETHAGGSDPEDSPFSDLSVLAVRR